MVSTLLVLSLLAEDPQGWTDPSAPPQAPSAATHFHGALELSGLALPSGTPGGGMDVFGVGLPVLRVDSGEEFGFELGAALRFRVFDEPPLQSSGDIGGVLRGADWSERSDFGQLLRNLRVGAESAPVYLRAGRMELETLGHGHLVNRYDNTLNPDYHPASATLSAAIGPTRTQLFASDILAARLFAGDFSLDVARLFTPEDVYANRYFFSISMAHDFGLAGYPEGASRTGPSSAPITLIHADADALIYRNQQVQVSGYAGGGARVLDAGVPLAGGAEAGFAVNASVGSQVTLGGKLEGRKQAGGFRPGMFGPDYELSRFASTGFSGPPLASDSLPDSFSGYAELDVGYGHATYGGEEENLPFIYGSIAAEYYLWGRLDGDASIIARFPNRKGSARVRVTVLDALGVVNPRYQAAGEVRYRLSPSFYLLATGGTVFFPQPDSTLVRGVFGSLGFGLDFER